MTSVLVVFGVQCSLHSKIYFDGDKDVTKCRPSFFFNTEDTKLWFRHNLHQQLQKGIMKTISNWPKCFSTCQLIISKCVAMAVR